MFVLGIDPGLSRCGFCVLDVGHGRRPAAAALGVIRTDVGAPVPERLADLLGDVRALIDEFQPQHLAVERVLFQVNVRTAMAVGQASGVIMAEAASRSIVVTEYSPNQVKEAVTGSGAADKHQVQEMVRRLLGLTVAPSPFDAADAAAVALCHHAHQPHNAVA